MARSSVVREGGRPARPSAEGGECRPGTLAEQAPEPQGIEADRDDDPVKGDALGFLPVVDLDATLARPVQADDVVGHRAHRLANLAPSSRSPADALNREKQSLRS